MVLRSCEKVKYQRLLNPVASQHALELGPRLLPHEVHAELLEGQVPPNFFEAHTVGVCLEEHRRVTGSLEQRESSRA